jgi:ATP-dependent protease Clp ATPase subunit
MTRTLKCSFCGKHAGQVGRLLAGPKVHICDACVAVSVKILDAVPPAFTVGWETMGNEQLLDALKPTAAAVDGTRAVLQAQVEELRKRSVSWDAIGSALGISRQAAWERFT